MIWGKNRWKSLKNVIIIGFAKAYMRVALYMLGIYLVLLSRTH